MKAAKLMGVDADQLISALVRPRIKVGTEWVHKGQNKQQVTHNCSCAVKNDFLLKATVWRNQGKTTFQGNVR